MITVVTDANSFFFLAHEIQIGVLAAQNVVQVLQDAKAELV